MADDSKVVEVEHTWTADLWEWPLQHNDGVVRVVNDQDRFEVGLDCMFFTPKEIEIKVIGQELVIYCRHEVRNDEHGSIAREVHRAYRLPPDVDTRTIKSTLTQKGVLMISAHKKQE